MAGEDGKPDKLGKIKKHVDKIQDEIDNLVATIKKTNKPKRKRKPKHR